MSRPMESNSHVHDFTFFRHAREMQATEYTCGCGARAIKAWGPEGTPTGGLDIVYDPVYLLPTQASLFEAQFFETELLR